MAQKDFVFYFDNYSSLGGFTNHTFVFGCAFLLLKNNVLSSAIQEPRSLGPTRHSIITVQD